MHFNKFRTVTSTISDESNLPNPIPGPIQFNSNPRHLQYQLLYIYILYFYVLLGLE